MRSDQGWSVPVGYWSQLPVAVAGGAAVLQTRAAFLTSARADSGTSSTAHRPTQGELPGFRDGEPGGCCFKVAPFKIRADATGGQTLGETWSAGHCCVAVFPIASESEERLV